MVSLIRKIEYRYLWYSQNVFDIKLIAYIQLNYYIVQTIVGGAGVVIFNCCNSYFDR